MIGIVHYISDKSGSMGDGFESFSDEWVVSPLKFPEEKYKISKLSISYDDDSSIPFTEGEMVEFSIIYNHGYDMYDNQIKGIDYYDVAKIYRHYTLAEKRDYLINTIIE